VCYRSGESAADALSRKQQRLGQLWEPTATTRAPRREPGAVKPEVQACDDRV